MSASAAQGSLQSICQTYDVAILYAFGSRAKEAAHFLLGDPFPWRASPSDLDLGIKALPGRSWSGWEKVDLAFALETFFDFQPVDLVSLDDAGPFLAAEIVSGERLWTDDEYLADEYDLYVLRRAGDLEPFERERARLLLGIAP